MDTPSSGATSPPLPPAASSAAAFDALDHAHRELVAAEVAELVAIVHAADLYRVDQSAVIDGVERLLQPGREGTPLVGEFLALEIGALLGISPGSAIARIGAALDLRHRLPKLWDAVVGGKARVWQALRVCDLTANLSVDAAGQIDGKLHHALATMPWSRILSALPGWVDAADLPAAMARQQQVAERRRVHVSQIEDGHVTLWASVDAADGIAFDRALSEVARTLPADGTGQDFDRRRAAAVGVLARQAFGQEALASHTLVVHISADDPAIAAGPASDGGVARVEKWGTLLTAQLPRFLAGARVIVRPVLDPATIPAVDQHDPPARMRFALDQRNPVDVFPYGTRPARACDVDHTVPYEAGGVGQTHLGNLGPLSRFTHRGKTHGGWRLEQPEPGSYRWTSPHGYQYLVTAAGTTRVSAAGREVNSRAA